MAKTSITAKLGLDTTAFQRGMAKSQKSVGKFVKSSIAKIGALTAAFAATAGVQRMTQHIQDMENAARLAGESSEEFQRIAFATKTVGIELEKTADILKDVKDKVGDFLATGAGPMADFFEQIAPKVGVTAEQFRHLSGKEALQLYVSSLEKANVSGNEMTFYMEAIASDAAALLPLLSNNSKELDNLANKADRLGAVIDSRTSKSIKQMNDSMHQTQSFATAMAAGAFVWGQNLAESFFIVARAATSSKVSVEDLVETGHELAFVYDPLKDKSLQLAKAQGALAMATDMSTQFFYDQIEAIDTLGDRLKKQADSEADIANKKFINAKKLEELQLRAAGKNAEADALKKQIELTEQAMRVSKQYGITLSKSAELVKGVEDNKQDRPSGGFSSGGFSTSDTSGGTSEARKAARGIRFEKTYGAGGEAYNQRFFNGSKAGRFSDDDLAKATRGKGGKGRTKEEAKQEESVDYLKSIDERLSKLDNALTE